MDPRKEDELLEIAKDTNRMVHKMHRSQMLGRAFTILIWFIVIAGPFIAYYFYFQTYVQPYLQKAQEVYIQLQEGSAQAQNVNSQISSFFGNLMQHGATTTPAK